MNDGNAHAHNLASLSNVDNDANDRQDPMCSLSKKLDITCSNKIDRSLVMMCQ